MFTLGNIATLVICIILLFTFRRFDRDNRSLEKVRKLADRLRDELAAYVDKRSEDLQRFGIELDVQQKAAKVALDKLQTVQEHLTGKTESLSEIERRLTEYDQTLARLIEMTSRVDENLARLQQESNFTESVNRKLDTARKSMDAIERELPLLREGFASDAARALESFKNGILVDISSSLQETEASLSHAREEGIRAVDAAIAARSGIDAVFEESFARARQEALVLENATYDKLREASDAKAARLRDAIEEKFLGVGQSAKALASEIQEAISGFHAEWETEAGDLLETARSEIRSTADSIAERLAVVESRVIAASADADQARDTAAGAVARAESQLLSMAETLQTESMAIRDRTVEEFDARIAEFTVLAESRFAALEKIGQETEGLDGRLRLTLDETRQRIEEEFASFGQAFEDHRTRFEDSFTGETARLRSELAGLQSDLEALKLRAYDQVKARLTGFEEDFLARLSEKSGMVEAMYATWKTELDARLASLADEEEESRRRSEAAHTADLEARVSGRIAAFTSSAESALENSSKKMRESLGALASSLAEEEGSIRFALESIQGEAGKLSVGYAEAIRQTELALRSELETFASTLGDLVERSRKEYESQRDAFDSAAEADRRRLSADLAKLEEEQRKLLAQTAMLQEAQALKDSLTVQVRELTASVERVEGRRASVAELENQIAKLKKTEEDVNQKMIRIFSEKNRIDSLDDNVRKLVALSQTVESRITGLTDHADELAELQASMHALRGMASEVDAKYERLEKKSSILTMTAQSVDENFETMKTLEASITSLEASLGTLPDRVAALSAEVEALAGSKAKAEDTTRIVAQLGSALEAALVKVAEVQKAREWIARAESRLEELDRHAREQFKILSSLLEEGPGKDWTDVPANIQDTVRKLGRQGWATEEIARTVKLSRSEVELILELGGKSS